MTKSKLSMWLLWSLVPNGILGFFSFLFYIFSDIDPEPQGAAILWALLIVISWPTWWLALLIGIGIKIWGGFSTRRSYKESRQYAELHGWQTISDTSWKSFKRRGITLSVNQAFQQPTFILSIDLDGEVIATDGFSKSFYALNFGDYIWDSVLNTSTQVSAEVITGQRREWEQTQALALRR